MEIRIKFSDITVRCKLLAEYEAQQAYGGGGNSLYATVLITDADDELLTAYAKEAVDVLSHVMGSALYGEVVYDSQGFALDMNDNLSAMGGGGSNGGLVQSLSEAVSVWCVHRWLQNKLPERSSAYKDMFADMSAVCKGLAFKREKPCMAE